MTDFEKALIGQLTHINSHLAKQNELTEAELAIKKDFQKFRNERLAERRNK